MATFTIAPDFGCQAVIKMRTVGVQYGDGYASGAGDGINTIYEEWPLTFSARTASERDAIIAFLKARNGYEPFDWTSPSGTVGRWRCTELNYMPVNAAANTITAKFVQDFAP